MIRKTIAVLALAALLFSGGCGENASGAAAVPDAEAQAVPAEDIWEPIPEEEVVEVQAEEPEEVPAVPEEPVPEEEVTGELPAEDASAEEVPTEEAEGAEEAAEEPALPVTVPLAATTNSEALAAKMEEFIAANGLHEGNFSCSYRNFATGEVYYCNELTIMTPASTYKLPMNMYYMDLEALGEYTEDSIIPGTGLPLSECRKKSLIDSDNPVSNAMLDNLDFVRFRQDLRQYFTLTDEEIDPIYYRRSLYCTRMMLDIACHLYEKQDSYQQVVACMLQAQPGLYFKRYITDVQVAQKYGSLDGWENCVGIVYSGSPFALCVYTHNAGGEDLVARCAKLFYDYTLGQ